MSVAFGGTQPQADELEITVFGRGFGECIVCHVGDGGWVIIDSFRDPNGVPIAVSYLNDVVGSDADVLAVIATHWDGDHIAGLGDVIDAFSPAEVWIPAVLNDREAFRFAYVHNEAMKGSVPSGLSDFVAVTERTARNRRWAITGLRVAERRTTAEVRVLTPTHEVVSEGFAALGARLEPGFGEVTSVAANRTSIVVSITRDGRRALLGGDLEKGAQGWRAVVASEESLSARFQILKVPHHGSPGADDPDVWSKLCTEGVTHVTSRYTKGVTPRPSAEDRVTLRGRAGTGWLVGAPGVAQLRRMDPVQANLEAATVDGFWKARGQVGAVRARCAASGTWQIHQTGSVQPI